MQLDMVSKFMFLFYNSIAVIYFFTQKSRAAHNCFVMLFFY